MWPKTRDEFLEWFWSGTNGNGLIKELNSCEFHGGDYIRREKERPIIYGVVLNDGSFPGKEDSVQWKLCKVGFTHVSTAEGTQNRMKQVQAEIKKKRTERTGREADAAVFFVLPIGAMDVTPFSDTEKRIRNAVGSPLHKDLAKKLGLPYSTEWVLTTQQFINQIRKGIKDLKAECSADLINLFKNLKFKLSEKPSWVKLEQIDGLLTVTDLGKE